MLVKNVVRGNIITFRTTFYDITNAVTTPDNPALTLYYKSNNAYVTVNVAMSAGANNTWVTTWNSSNADVGIVEWHVSSGSNTGIAYDGDFRVLANKANGGQGAS